MAGCCAIGTCDNPECYICVVMPAKFAIVLCPTVVDGERCRYVKDHPGGCTIKPRPGKVERADLKEAKGPLPDLSGPRAAAAALSQIKRKREGAFRQQRR